MLSDTQRAISVRGDLYTHIFTHTRKEIFNGQVRWSRQPCNRPSPRNQM